MPQSPELAGGAGFTFEGAVGALYLTHLLAEGYAPGIDDRIVCRVAFQQRDFGEPLDDVIVDFRSANRELARLSLQAKRSLVISKAKNNTDFREIIRDSWATLNKANFRNRVDRFGAAVGVVAKDKARALATLCELARESVTVSHFDTRFAPGGNASAEIKGVRDDIAAIINEIKGGPCTDEEVHQFLAHFVLIKFDFLHSGSDDPPQAITRLRDCLVPTDAEKAPLVWSRLIELSRASAGKAGEFDRARLIQSISQVAALRGAHFLSPLRPNGILADVSVLIESSDSWNLGDDTIVRYSLTKEDDQVKISYRLGYAEQMDAGGPIGPLRYISSKWCPFWWDFPTLDFKILNNSQKTLFLTEVILDIDESRPDLRPLFAIKRDIQQSCAGDLLLVNEGWCDLLDINISFNLLPGEIPEPAVPEPPYRHSIDLPLLPDHAEIDVTQAFEREGVNITGLILISNGRWKDNETIVIPTAEGLDEKISLVQFEERKKLYLAAFNDHVGTLVGEIGFTAANDPNTRRKVKFHDVVYLANANRRGLPRPPTATYGTIFETAATSYQRRVQISHEIRAGETDRFTVKIAVRQSSIHNFSAKIRDIAGVELKLPLIQMGCFVPRSRRKFVESHLNSSPT